MTDITGKTLKVGDLIAASTTSYGSSELKIYLVDKIHGDRSITVKSPGKKYNWYNNQPTETCIKKTVIGAGRFIIIGSAKLQLIVDSTPETPTQISIDNWIEEYNKLVNV